MLLTMKLFELIPLDWPTQLLLRITTCEDKGSDHLGWKEHLLNSFTYCVCLLLVTCMVAKVKTFHVYIGGKFYVFNLHAWDEAAH